MQLGHLWKVLRGRVCFISKISERNTASWFKYSNWRRGLYWFSSVSIFFTFKSLLCCASFSLCCLLLTTASETNWRRCLSEMFTFQSTWWRLLQILLFHIPVEIAYRNQCWTSYLSYQHSSFFAWISAFSRLLISFTTKSYVDSLTDSTELFISVSVEEESFSEKWLCNQFQEHTHHLRLHLVLISKSHDLIPPNLQWLQLITCFSDLTVYSSPSLATSVKPTLTSSCFTNNMRELTNTKSSDYNVIVKLPSAEWSYKIKTFFY